MDPNDLFDEVSTVIGVIRDSKCHVLILVKGRNVVLSSTLTLFF